jgi:hypothetical protein
MVTLDDSLWGEWATQDAALAILFDTQGQAVTYARLAELAGDRYVQYATPEHWKRQYAAVRQAVDHLARALAQARLDVLLIVGDDQLEIFSPTNMPALALCYGERIVSGLWNARFATYQRQGQPPPTPLSPRLQHAVAAGYAMETRRVFASAPTFARTLLASLSEQGFDVAGLGDIAPSDETVGLGHAYGAIVTQLIGEQTLPIVPIFINTYFPPNQPTPSRCYDLGLALHHAIATSPADLRVGLVASGGLSHFVTDEQLDRQVLAALRTHAEAQLRSIPRHLLNSGSSEIRNWIAVAAASRQLHLRWDAYIPVYRTPAGTGCGLGFACWS